MRLKHASLSRISEQPTLQCHFLEKTKTNFLDSVSLGKDQAGTGSLLEDRLRMRKPCAWPLF